MPTLQPQNNCFLNNSIHLRLFVSFARATMAENQEMSPIEMKVAQQIEVMVISFNKLLCVHWI